MAEKIVSPGVFTNEVDQSYLPSRIAAIGAAVVGPTQKGPAGIPTTVSSYSEFLQVFGGVFNSGSGASEQSYKYLTNYAAQEYLKYADTLTVVRVLAGSPAPAQSTVSSSGGTATTARIGVQLSALVSSSFTWGGYETNGIRIETAGGAIIGTFVTGSGTSFFYGPTNQGYFVGGTPTANVIEIRNLINNTPELSAQLSASANGTILGLSSSLDGAAS